MYTTDVVLLLLLLLYDFLTGTTYKLLTGT